MEVTDAPSRASAFASAYAWARCRPGRAACALLANTSMATRHTTNFVLLVLIIVSSVRPGADLLGGELLCVLLATS